MNDLYDESNGGNHMTTSALRGEETAVTTLPRPQSAINARLLIGALVLFTAFLGLFAYVQYGTDALVGTDGYYHVKMGYLIRQEGLKPGFPWLPQTILNEEAYYDHHLLFHVYLALFAATDPGVDGGLALTQSGKIASIIMPALAFMAIWWLLRGQNVPWASLWALGLFAVSEAFLYRMSMPRAQSASLLVLALGLHWLLQKRYRLLLPLGFVYVWFYNAFPLLIVMAVVYVVAALMTERRLAWQALVFPAVGIVLGIVINPYFPQDVTFIINHLLPKLGGDSIPVGNEWSPYRTWTLVQNSGPALAAFVLGVMALGWREKRMDKSILVSFTLAILFGYMLFQSRRFVEYFPPFALIFAALSAAPLLREWQVSEWWGKRPLRQTQGKPYLTPLLPIAMLAILAWPLYATLNDARSQLADSNPADQYAEAALWLRANAEPGAIVFQTDWDDFTRLFFYNTDAIYTVGLDPTYLELYDADLYNEWVDITRGRVEQPSRVIRERFGGQYIFSDLNHDDFIDQAQADPQLKEVYRDDYAVIFSLAN
jgi:intracellular septation protein A